MTDGIRDTQDWDAPPKDEDYGFDNLHIDSRRSKSRRDRDWRSRPSRLLTEETIR